MEGFFLYKKTWVRIQGLFYISHDDEIIFFKDRKYRWDGRYYKAGRWRKTCLYLHRSVYEHFYGNIQDGHHVHHIDENTRNNDISNLQSIEKSEHLSYQVACSKVDTQTSSKS